MKATQELTSCPLCGHVRAARLKTCTRCLGEGPAALPELEAWDPTGYYRHKAVTRAPMAGIAGMCALVALVMAVLGAIFA